MPLRAYTRFVASNPRFLFFGFVVAFGSSFGQTFFIGIFGPHLQREFDLSHTAWGTIYLFGTLGSALLLPWTGKLIDRIELTTYTTYAILAAVAACAFFALVGGPFMLVIAIFMLRQTGQGLASHIAMTSMARYFSAERGRAIAVGSAGYAAGEAVLPLAAVMVITAVGWRWTYAGIAVLLLFVAVPLARWLLSGHEHRDRALADETRRSANGTNDKPLRRSWTRTEVVRDPRFYLLLTGVSGISIIITALFFHHLNIADAKSWSHEWVTGSYIVYSVAGTSAALLSGPLIDRFGATRLVPMMPVPMLLALLVIAQFDSKFTVWVYLGLLGLSSGLYFTSVTAMWAELYGVAYLGGIKALVTSVGVFGSAIGPVIMGGLMDMGASVAHVCWVFAGYTALSSILSVIAVRREPVLPAAPENA